MKDIVTLCRELPASEPEIRERALEFNQLVSLLVIGEPCGPATNFILNIADAKAATDAMIARGCLVYYVGIDRTLHKCEITFHDLDTQVEWKVGADATTEELARSACALLAAEAMKGDK